MLSIQQDTTESIVYVLRFSTENHNGGKFLAPSEMQTKHLFYTWLMIWNHAAPKSMRIWNHHRYVFDSFYTPIYMLQAFKALYLELKARDDLGSKMRGVIERIETLYKQTFYKDAELHT